MVRVKRLEEMLKYIETNGSVSLDELCEVFQISKIQPGAILTKY